MFVLVTPLLSVRACHLLATLGGWYLSLGVVSPLLLTWASSWLAFVVFLATAQVVLGCSICLALPSFPSLQPEGLPQVLSATVLLIVLVVGSV